MFYNFLKILAQIAISIVFKKIHYHGLENIKKDRPTLIACNHPGGFTEPIILACLLRMPIHFLVRGDLFRNPWLRHILINTNQIPIFRFKDGIKNLRENQKYLDLLKDKLVAGERIMIFVEGSTENEMQLRTPQKGIARIAQDALKENPELLIDVVPMGITFTDSLSYRSDVMLSLGEPLVLDKSFIENEKLKAKELTETLYDLMKPEMVHLDDLKNKPSLQKKIDQILIKSWRCISLPWTHSRKNLTECISVANELNNGIFEMPSQKLELSLVNKIAIIFGFFLALPGLLIYAMPYFLINSFANKKVKKPVFYSSIVIACIVVSFIVYHLIIWGILAFIGMGWYILSLIPLAIISLWYCDLHILNIKIKKHNESIS